MPAHDELHARLFLLHAAEPPAPAIHHYVAVHGPVDAVAQIRHGTAPAAVLSEITRPDARIDDDLRALDSGTARLLGVNRLGGGTFASAVAGSISNASSAGA